MNISEPLCHSTTKRVTRHYIEVSRNQLRSVAVLSGHVSTSVLYYEVLAGAGTLSATRLPPTFSYCEVLLNLPFISTTYWLILDFG